MRRMCRSGRLAHFPRLAADALARLWSASTLFLTSSYRLAAVAIYILDQLDSTRTHALSQHLAPRHPTHVARGHAIPGEFSNRGGLRFRLTEVSSVAI
jgi:hypothetical protein